MAEGKRITVRVLISRTRLPSVGTEFAADADDARRWIEAKLVEEVKPKGGKK